MDRKNTRIMNCCWKVLYCKLTELNVNIPEENIKDELESNLESFKHGLTNYDILEDFWDLSGYKDQNLSHEMEAFFLKLVKALQLQPVDCKLVFGNYLLHDFRHSINPLKELIAEDITAVVLSVWRFFNREKLFHLRCLKHVIVSRSNRKNRYQNTFKEVLLKLPLRELYDQLVNRFNHVISLPLPSYSSHGEITEHLLPYWIDYNLQEQLHLMHLIVLIAPHIEFDFRNLKNHFDLLRVTLFGTMQHYAVHNSASQERNQRMISYLINVHAIQLMKTGWSENIYCDHAKVYDEHNLLINGGDYRIEKGPLVASWILVKCFKLMDENNFSKQEVAREYGYCNVDIWLFVREIVDNDLFQDNSDLLKIVMTLSDEMLALSFEYFEMRIFNSLDTLVSLVSSIAKFKGPSDVSKSVSYIWDYFSDIFPTQLGYFMQITQSLLNADSCITANEIIQKCCNLKYNVFDTADGFSTTNFLSKYYLENPVRPLQHFQEVVIIAGTEVFYNYDENLIRFNMFISPWKIISNFIKCNANSGLRNYSESNAVIHHTILQCIKFCCVVLKKSPQFINDMFTCVEDMLNLVHKISSDNEINSNFDIFASCLDLSTVLLNILPDDVLYFYSGLRLLPDYDRLVKLDHLKFSSHHYDGYSLWSIIESEERKLKSFTVLLSYLKLLRKLVSNKETLESWYVLGGLSLIYKVFVKLEGKVWAFKQSKDFNLIVWCCLDIIGDIMTNGITYVFENSGPAFASKKPLENFTKRNDDIYAPSVYFLTEQCVALIRSNDNQHVIASIAATGEAGLFEKMENYVSWCTGSSAILINTICSALSLLYRSLVYSDVLTQKGIVVQKLSQDKLQEIYNAAAILTYTNNCFSYYLKVLAVKVLCRLADEYPEYISFGLNLPKVHLRKEFLQPLISSNITDEYKIILLTFAAKCIIKQKIIANALIDVEHTNKMIELSGTDDGRRTALSLISKNKNNIFSYIVLHLTDTSDQDITVTSQKVHCAVLKLLHTVWESDLFHLRLYFTILPTFWESLCKPLFKEPVNSFLGYSSIFGIIKLEIVKNSKIDSSLSDILEKFSNSDLFSVWMKYCISTADTADSLFLLYLPSPIQKKDVSKSWKEFLLAVSVRLKTSIRNPEKVASFALEELAKDVNSMSVNPKLIYLCELYMIFLFAWKEKCSLDWKHELHLICDIFEKLPQLTSSYESVSDFCTILILISCRVFDYGKSSIAKVLSEREYVIDKLLEFFVDQLNDSPGMGTGGKLEKKKHSDATLPLYVCLLTDVLINVKGRMTNLLVYKMKYSGLFSRMISFVSNIHEYYETAFETSRIILKFFKLILQQCQNTKKYLDVDKNVLDFIFLMVPTDNVIESLAQLKNAPTNNKASSILDSKWFEIYHHMLDIILVLLPHATTEISQHLIKVLPKHLELWSCLFIVTENSTNEKHLTLVASCMAFFKFTLEHTSVWNDDCSLILETAKQMRWYVFSIMKLLLHPSKICCFLYGVETDLQLQEIFKNGLIEEKDVNIIKSIYNKLLLISRLGVSTLAKFSMPCELIPNTVWFSNDLKYSKYFDNVFSRLHDQMDPEILPHLHWDEINLISTFVDQSYSCIDNPRSDVNDKAVFDAIMRTTPGLLYADSKTALVHCCILFLSELAGILLSHNRNYKEKQVLATHVYLNMRDFLNAKYSASKYEQIVGIPTSPTVFTLPLVWCSSYKPHLVCSSRKNITAPDLDSQTTGITWNYEKSGDGFLFLSYQQNPSDCTIDNDQNYSFVANKMNQSTSNNFSSAYLNKSQPELLLEFENFDEKEDRDESKRKNDTLNDILLYAVSRLAFKLLLSHKYD